MKYYFVFEESQEGIPTLIIYRDDGMLMFGSTPKVVNVFTGEKLAEFLDHFGPINTLAVHKNILASGGEDSSVKVHDIEHYLFS